MGPRPTCKGNRDDGSPCRYYATDSGYCHLHKNQAQTEEQQGPDVSGKWTRERLEAAIAAHGGPEGLDLAGADLTGLHLRAMNLQGVVFARYEYEDVCYLVGVNLHGAWLEGANLEGADLRMANLQWARLEGASLQEAILQGANLDEAMLQDANLQWADLQGAHLQGTKLLGANLQGANLECAHLQKAYLRNSDLQAADLRRANLQGADLQGANLQRADLRDANLQEADLQGANCTQLNLLDVAAGGLRGVRLYRATLDRTMIKREQLGTSVSDEAAGEYRVARDIYLALKQNFESLGDYAASAWAYVKECRMEALCSHPRNARKYYGAEEIGGIHEQPLPNGNPRVWWFYVRHTTRYLGHRLVDWACGYGESWLKTLRAMGVTFLAFVAIYWLFWAVTKQVPRGECGYDDVPTRAIVDVLVFSTGAFTTMDPRGLGPLPAWWVQPLMTLEALLGISLTGLLGFVLGNRIRRS